MKNHPLLTESNAVILERLAWCVLAPTIPFDGPQFFSSDNEKRLFWREVRAQFVADESYSRAQLQHRIEQLNSFRLGLLFEALYAFMFELHPDYTIVAQNQQLMDNGQTVGELDLVLNHRINARHYHIELACKFYLEVQSIAGKSYWVGTNCRDRLDKKVAHLAQHQLQLSQRQPFLRSYDPPLESSALLRGCLFRPFDELWTEASGAAVWATSTMIKRWPQYAQLSALPLQKYQWLGLCSEQRPEHSLAEQLDQLERPTVLVLEPSAGAPNWVFWVPEHWPQTAVAALP
ncbi:MAG: DUF1853 family protein [Gammaproteobacteria bacterium]|nr:DUF1853 family protein [Gammaproteobacteria bacterium]